MPQSLGGIVEDMRLLWRSVVGTAGQRREEIELCGSKGHDSLGL